MNCFASWRAIRMTARVCAYCLTAILIASTVSAGVNVWTTSGPEGGHIRALAIDPANSATLYVGTDGGVFKSTNGGASWTNSLFNASVYALAIDPSTPATLYAGALNGVFRSTNGGGIWSAVNVGLTNTFVTSLVMDPSAPGALYAGTVNGGGVFKSTNSAESWAASFSAGLTGTHVYALAIDPTAPATIYAGGADRFGGASRAFKSTNGGGSWTAINAGLTSTHLYALAIDPSMPATLYAGTQGGAFKSTNGGQSWAAINGLSNTSVYAFAIDLSTPATLYAGTQDGVFQSTDDGGSWRPINIGLTTPLVQALAVDPSAPATLYAGTFVGGVFKSTDRGGRWGPINTGLHTPSVYALAIDSSFPATIYAGTSHFGVSKSTDGGVSWTFPSAHMTYIYVNVLAIDPSSPATLYAGTDQSPWDYDVIGVFKSTDGGGSWRSVNAGLPVLPFVHALAIDPSAPTTLYAGTWGDGVFKSTNGGGSWTAINIGLANTSVLELAIDPSAPSTIYAGTTGGVFKSTNGGGSWSAINAGLTATRVEDLVIDPSAPATLYAGTSGGVFKSTNGGGSWRPINTGLTNAFVGALAIDPANPATLYAGTEGSGVFKSTNAGGSWTAMNAGLTHGFVRALAIDPSTPTKLYAGTEGGVYEYTASEAPCVSDLTTLCLSGGRFEVTTQWTDRAGQSGDGQAVALPGGDTGYFTFFNSDNVEVVVKILNGCSVNGSFWTLAGGLTDVSVVMTVTDSQTGTVKSYSNPQDTPFQPIQDTTGFATCSAGATAGARPYGGSAGASLLPPNVMESFDASTTEPCVPNATTLCLSNSRYQVRTQWYTQDGRSGVGQVIPLTGDTGAFWFFGSSNLEVVIKVLNGCRINSRHWTFAAGLTDVNVILAVTDTQTGAIQTYTNPQGTLFLPIQDTNAFATCP